MHPTDVAFLHVLIETGGMRPQRLQRLGIETQRRQASDHSLSDIQSFEELTNVGQGDFRYPGAAILMQLNQPLRRELDQRLPNRSTGYLQFADEIDFGEIQSRWVFEA